jgi:hypothetical protein
MSTKSWELHEPISGIERQQLDFRSFGQVGGFIND